MLTGRLEQENKLRNKIDERLEQLPEIFTSFYNYLESDQKSYGTIKHYIEYVADFMDYVTRGKNNDVFYETVQVPQIREYIVSLRRREEDGVEVKNSESIQAARWSALNTFYNFLVMDDYIEVNPMTKTKRPKNKKQSEVVYLEQDEINTILDKVRADARINMVNRDLAIITLGIATGLRVAAIVAIDIDDVDFKNNTIRVIEKGHKDRVVTFGANTRAILSQWILDRSTYFEGAATSALFVSQTRQRMTEEGVRKLIKRYTAGLSKHITPHNLRKTAATQACKSGIDINTVANMLGHNSISTTQRYMAVAEESKKQAVNALDNLF